MQKALFLLKFLVDADAWQIWCKMKLLYFLTPPCSKNVPALLYETIAASFNPSWCGTRFLRGRL